MSDDLGSRIRAWAEQSRPVTVGEVFSRWEHAPVERSRPRVPALALAVALTLTLGLAVAGALLLRDGGTTTDRVAVLASSTVPCDTEQLQAALVSTSTFLGSGIAGRYHVQSDASRCRVVVMVEQQPSADVAAAIRVAAGSSVSIVVGPMSSTGR